MNVIFQRRYCERLISRILPVLALVIALWSPIKAQAGLVIVGAREYEVLPATPAEKCLTVLFFSADASNSELEAAFDRLVATLRRANSPLIVVSPYERDDKFRASASSYESLFTALCENKDLSEFGVTLDDCEELRVILCCHYDDLCSNLDKNEKELKKTQFKTLLESVKHNSKWRRKAFFVNDALATSSARGADNSGRSVRVEPRTDSQNTSDAGEYKAEGEDLNLNLKAAICELQYVSTAFFFDVLQEAFSRASSRQGEAFVSVCDAVNHVNKMIAETGDLDKRIVGRFSLPMRDWVMYEGVSTCQDLPELVIRELIQSKPIQAERYLPGRRNYSKMRDKGRLLWYQARLRALGAKVANLDVRPEDHFEEATHLPVDVAADALIVRDYLYKSLYMRDGAGLQYVAFLLIETSSGERFFLSAKQVETQCGEFLPKEYHSTAPSELTIEDLIDNMQ